MLNQSRPETAIPRKEPGKGTLPRLRAKRNPAPHAHETTRRGGCREPSAKLHEFATRSTDMAQERDPARRNPFGYEDISIFTVQEPLLGVLEISRRDDGELLGVDVLAQGGVDVLDGQCIDLGFEIGVELHGPADEQVFGQ